MLLFLQVSAERDDLTKMLQESDAEIHVVTTRLDAQIVKARCGMVLVWSGVVWCGVGPGVVWPSVWRDVAWCGLAWHGLV
jgi:hypothetical protein